MSSPAQPVNASPIQSAFYILTAQDIALRSIDGETQLSNGALLAIDALETAATTWAEDTPAAMGIIAMLQSLVPCETTWLGQVHLLRRTVDLWAMRARG